MRIASLRKLSQPAPSLIGLEACAGSRFLGAVLLASGTPSATDPRALREALPEKSNKNDFIACQPVSPKRAMIDTR